MEIVAFLSKGSSGGMGDILWMAVYFSGFGLTVGAALGMTEGYVQKQRRKMVYGLSIGLVLGVVGGFIGGAAGETIFDLAPRHASASNADVAIALDSSGSMRTSLFFFVGGSDPNGERRKAAKGLIDRLTDQDRAAIVDFDDTAKVYFPLAPLNSTNAREEARQAVDRVDDSGGTNLSAGLDAAVAELTRNKVEGRRQFVIFLTDGVGAHDPSSEMQAKAAGITIYTIGLGSDVNSTLLTDIAQTTGGKYYPVSDAAQLSTLFQQIYTENINMVTQASGAPVPGSSPAGGFLQAFLRILSWSLMGLAIGAGQGVRENTREDLRACALGGLIGGAVGGALFDPVSSAITFGFGLFGRGLADIVVGACIGGSMRLAQSQMVEKSGKETTTLLSVLPQKGGLVVLPESGDPRQKPAPAPVAPVGPVKRPPTPAASTPVTASAAAVSRSPLAVFQKKYADRSQAMAMAFKSGDFTLGEIAEHFGVQSTTVKRAVEQFAGR
jgi:hypothetical protein